MNGINRFEWTVLDNMSDAKESVSSSRISIQKEFPDKTKTEIAKTFFNLYNLGFIFEDHNKMFDLQSLINESDNRSEGIFWFGLTDKGSKAWETMAPIYNEPIDWSNAVHCTFSTNNHTGYIEGISKEVCFVWLEKLEKEQGWHADKNTFVGSEIEGFWAKYYKFIPGGYKIRFIYK